jgi:hypothetical protein
VGIAVLFNLSWPIEIASQLSAKVAGTGWQDNLDRGRLKETVLVNERMQFYADPEQSP